MTTPQDLKGQQRRHYEHSAEVLYRVFRHDGMDTAEAAAAIGVPEDTLHKWILGKTACPPEKLAALYAWCRHPDLADLLTPDGYELRPVGTAAFVGQTLPSFEAEILEDYEALQEFVTLYRRLRLDGRLDASDLRKLHLVKAKVISVVEKTFAFVLDEAAKGEASRS